MDSSRRISGITQFSGSVVLTYRELIATWVALGLLIVTTLGWLLLALSLSLDVVEGSIAALRIFGLESTPTQGVQDPVSGEWLREALSLESWVFGVQKFVFGAAYMLGSLLGLFATIPLTVEWISSGRIELMLAKPISRPRLLVGHVAGVWLTALTISSYLIFSIWLVICFKSGLWTAGFLWATPIIVIMFAVVYGGALLLITLTRSSALGLIVSYGLVFFSLVFSAKDQLLPQLGAAGRAVYLGFYHALPNFIEVIGIGAQLVEGGAVNSWYPLYSSILFGVVCYSASVWWFSRRDF